MTSLGGLRDPGGRHEYPWHLGLRRAVRHLPIGKFDVRVLDQNTLWVDSAGGRHRVRNLSDEHLANIIVMLRYTAVGVFTDYSTAAGLGRFRPRTAPPPMSGEVRAVAERWLASTPVWLALHRELARRNSRDPAQRHCLGAGPGTWVVCTEGATYVLDQERARVMEVWPGEDPLPTTDALWHPLRTPARVQVQRSLDLDTERVDRLTARAVSSAKCVVSICSLPLDEETSDQDVLSHARLIARPRQSLTCERTTTVFRTPRFLNEARKVRFLWAALDAVTRQHGAVAPLLVPRRLREPEAHAGAVDLLVDDLGPRALTDLQRQVDDAVGHHLPVTGNQDYWPRRSQEIASHAVPLSPGT